MRHFMTVSALMVLGLVQLQLLVAQETLLTGVPFDCTNKQTGPNKDAKYCDVYHACVHGKQLKTYVCPHVGLRYYFDANTLKCELAPEGKCPNNAPFYAPLSQPPVPQVQQQVRPQMPAVVAPPKPQRPPQIAVPQIQPVQTWTAPTPTQMWTQAPVVVPAWKQQQQQQQQQKWTPEPPVWINGQPTWNKKSQSSFSLPLSAAAQPVAQPRFPSPPQYKLQQQQQQQQLLKQSFSGLGGADNSQDIFRVPTDTSNTCAGQRDGTFVPSALYCNVFHRCINGKNGLPVRKDFRCTSDSAPFDLWWNQAKQRCDYPCLVGCNKQVYGSTFTAQQTQVQNQQANPVVCARSGIVAGSIF